MQGFLVEQQVSRWTFVKKKKKMMMKMLKNLSYLAIEAQRVVLIGIHKLAPSHRV
jgi:hypothetical protein